MSSSHNTPKAYVYESGYWEYGRPQPFGRVEWSAGHASSLAAACARVGQVSRNFGLRLPVITHEVTA